MNEISALVNNSDGSEGVMFYCHGCKMSHMPIVKAGHYHTKVCQWNGSLDKPTFKPSIKVQYPWKGIEQLCHSYVTDGKIQYLGDCTHELKGQTIELEPY